MTLAHHEVLLVVEAGVLGTVGVGSTWLAARLVLLRRRLTHWTRPDG